MLFSICRLIFPHMKSGGVTSNFLSTFDVSSMDFQSKSNIIELRSLDIKVSCHKQLFFHCNVRSYKVKKTWTLTAWRQTHTAQIHWNVKSQTMTTQAVDLNLLYDVVNTVCPTVFSSVCRYENLFHFSSLRNDRTVTSLVGLSWSVEVRVFYFI